MAKVTVDGIEIEVPNGYTVLQAAEAAGKEIPRFCYHEKLSIAGNCRMCLVEVEKMPKPVASCGQPVGEGMVIYTDSEKVREARRGVMEFLLINHPLDCPICDQGGECDLQDEAMGYGRDHSRYIENKRAVNEKDFGPLVKTNMTRCIHCTRCIRFMSEIAGTPELGAIARGESMEITTYTERPLSSELSGNIINLCPVGALTSKPYAFVARPWELGKTDSIDALDAVGSNIRIDTRATDVLRILPRINDAVNEEWLGDKSRFSHDGLRRRRLDRPWIRRDGKLRPANWDEALQLVATRLLATPGERVGAIAGNLCEAESMFALKELMTLLGSGNLDCRQDGAALDASRREFYLFNTTIEGIEQADSALIIGGDPRREAPVLNARLRKIWFNGGATIGTIGAASDLTYDVHSLGNEVAAIRGLLDGSHEFGKILEEAKRPMVILGQSALARPDGAAVLGAAWEIARKFGMIGPEWHGFNVLHNAASRVGALDMGFLPQAGGKSMARMMDGGVDILFLLGADEFDMERIGRDTFVIYQGHHGDRGAARADVILPGATYAEKHGLYVNTEGRVQKALRALFPPGEAREDWKIIRALSGALGRPLPYNTLEALRQRLAEAYPSFGEIDRVRRPDPATEGPAFRIGELRDEVFLPPPINYYQTDPISRASPTMARCVEAQAAYHLPLAAE
ncbi:MAG TPA: NADH-quinone oxidoreductase subunit NuoG [Acetobacteraceae bacterium]|nr:NADH-quinone oxidoreductase subunit NuoG [Acetobacteraceae bacterium]